MLWFDWMISGVFSFYVLHVLSLLIVHIHIDCLSVYPSLLCQHIFHCWISTMISHQQSSVQAWVSEGQHCDTIRHYIFIFGSTRAKQSSLKLVRSPINWRLLVYVWITWEMRQHFLQLVKGTSRARSLEPCVGPYHLCLFGPHQHQHAHFMRNQKPVHASPVCLSAILHHSTSYVHRWHRDGPIFVIYH